MKKQDSNSLKNVLCSQLIPEKGYIVRQNIVPEKGFNDLINPKNWSRIAKYKMKKLNLEEGIDYECMESSEFHFQLGDKNLVNEKCIVREYQNKVILEKMDEYGDAIQRVWIVTDETDTKLISISINVD